MQRFCVHGPQRHGGAVQIGLRHYGLASHEHKVPASTAQGPEAMITQAEHARVCLQGKTCIAESGTNLYLFVLLLTPCLLHGLTIDEQVSLGK